MEKTDLRTENRDLYSPRTGQFALVTVPRFDFLMIDGHGDPNASESYVQALEALYALSYGAKFASKAQLGRDYVVLPLEGLWRAESPEAFLEGRKNEWSWTMMIRQPSWLTADVWDAARAAAATKQLPALDAVRLESFEEGPCAQVLYLGPYSDEGPTITALHEWIAAHGRSLRGDHHEIYLGDPRRSAPEKLRTIIRQPVSAA